MKENPLKATLAEGNVVLGSWLSFYDPAVAEIMAQAGFDWLSIDSEHAPLSLDLIENMLMAFRGTNTVPIVRVAWNDPVLIKQALDMGPEGLIIPSVNTAEEARHAVAACKYPPQGIRGVAPRRAAAYGAEMLEYLTQANERILIVVQIEHIKAVENIEEILKVEGIDVAFAGPADLTASLGLLPEFGHPKVQEAIERVLDKCLEARVPFGIHTGSVEEARYWASRGAQMISIKLDMEYLRGAVIETVAEFRNEMS